MKIITPFVRFWYHRPVLAAATTSLSIFTIWRLRHIIQTFLTLLLLPITWPLNAGQYLINPESDAFDLTFSNYSHFQDTAGHPYDDCVPPVLHHIALGSNTPQKSWQDARQSCLDLHSGWEAHLWTDENAGRLVAEKFPDLKPTWDSYRYPVQRIDALRYMVLYEYGGVVLDMDLQCKRALGPLRRFEFVAPAAHPTGFSIGFMMATRHNPFVGELVASLKTYNHQWLGMPYTTVMFSTGCHFASTIHALQRNRSGLKILAGPKGQLELHRLNGNVSTPIFDHLGSSSWHSYDASMIVWLGKFIKGPLPLLAFIFLCFIIFALMKSKRKTVPKLRL